MTKEQLNALLAEAEKLHHRYNLSKTVGPDWYEPGKMEYLDQSDGVYDVEANALTLRFESRGTRYDGRTEQIESLRIGDVLRIERDPENPYNANNFRIYTTNGHDVGNMPAELCNVIAPLYDEGTLLIESASASFVEPISKRNRHAKQAILFVKMRCILKNECI